jgi:ATP-dependent DNA helicase RecG
MDLHSRVTDISGVGSIVKKKMEKLGITTIEDLLYHIPFRYEDFRKIVTTTQARVGEAVSIKAQVDNTSHIYSKSGKKMFVAELSDQFGKIKAVWFSQPYLSSIIRRGSNYIFSGRVEWIGRQKALVTPLFQHWEGSIPSSDKLIFPIYPETKGITSKWFRTKIGFLIDNYPELLKEFIPEKFAVGMMSFKDAVQTAHKPSDLEKVELARRRLGFNELLKLFITNQKRKENWKSHKSTAQLNIKKDILSRYEKMLPFQLTNSQITAIKEIFSDLQKTTPMNRLLEGDVGSGKTAVAAAACYAAYTLGYQSAIMAPTQILAIQHYNTLQSIFKNQDIKISLLSGSISKTTEGKTDIFVGTHALLHRNLDFDKVALVVIDEQHRFGVEQRTHLIVEGGKKGKIPHVLTMTATPIPRTVAMSLYGDLDLSVLDEMPKGRIPTTTWIVPPEKRVGAYEWIRQKIINEKIAVFIVCPLIEESDKESLKDIKSAKKEFENVRKVFPEFGVGLLHGRLKTPEKERVIDNLRNGKIDILVSTAVVEVGVDIPRAAIIVIEAAERFGLAQLHQLRGRVGRGNQKSYCLLFTQSHSEKIHKRLSLLSKHHSGAKLAQMDLELRGPGEIFGTAQSGFSKLKAASWSDFDLIKKAKNTSEEISKDKKLFTQIFRYFYGDITLLN